MPVASAPAEVVADAVLTSAIVGSNASVVTVGVSLSAAVPDVSVTSLMPVGEEPVAMAELLTCVASTSS